MEIEELASYLDKNTSNEILKMWSAGRPIKGIELKKVENLLIEPDAVRLIIEGMEHTLSEYGYSGIYCITGEAGSGKSQIALFAMESFKNKMGLHYFRVDSLESIEKIGREMENMTGMNIAFVDEIDSLLGSLNEEERRKAIEKLENILILHAEEPKKDKSIAAVLLLNRRSYKLIKDSAPRLGRRIIEPKLGIPSDYESLPQDGFSKLAKIVLAVIYSAKKELFPSSYTRDVLNLLEDWSVSYREKIMGSASVGTCLKEILRAYLKILENLERDFKPMDKIEEGNKIEEVFRELFSRYLQQLKFDIEGRKYVASLERSKGIGADLSYRVYPGEIPSGRPVRIVNIEIKCGHYNSLRKDQLIKYGQQGPLLIIWIHKEEPDKLEELVNQVEREASNPVDYICIPYELIRPAIYMKDPEILMRELGIREDLEAKLQNSFKYIERRRMKPPVQVGDVQQNCKKAVEILVQKLKPDEKDGKNFQVGRVSKDLRKILLDELGIPIDDTKSDIIAGKLLSELEKHEFFERKKIAKGESKIFYSKLSAWKARRDDAVDLISKILIEELRTEQLSPL